MLALGPEQGDVKGLLAELEEFNRLYFEASRLRSGNMSLTSDQVIVLISPFNNAATGLEYLDRLKEFQENSSFLTKEELANSFIISLENFQQLNRRKDLHEYLRFYKRAYSF
ncbi:hypothetical protein [Nitritalea halalkaliphila]|uniref:hypothetical protein n=1 Tax=Nitritalea halalkaliphila TaxID=590849 RepID=UPI0002DFA5CD|nr:hypothetical protein [Nitritalea halalkaliphila]